jgi:hypothetical protein
VTWGTEGLGQLSQQDRQLRHLGRNPPRLATLPIRHSGVHKKEQKQSDHNQDHPHNRPNNQTGHISKRVGSMIGYY